MEDVEMEDVSTVFDRKVEATPGGATFKRASFIQKSSQNTSVKEGNDFSFMKKTVRVNAVDKCVKEYMLEEDEIEAKKHKGKKKYL